MVYLAVTATAGGLVVAAATLILALGLLAPVGIVGRRFAQSFTPMRNRPFMAAYCGGAGFAFGVDAMASHAPLVLGLEDLVLLLLLLWAGFTLVAVVAANILRIVHIPLWLGVSLVAAWGVVQLLHQVLSGGPVKITSEGERICAQMGGIEMLCPDTGQMLAFGAGTVLACAVSAALGVALSERLRRRAGL